MRLDSEGLQVCAESASDRDPVKTMQCKGVWLDAVYVTFIEKITEESLLLQHISIYYNDNDSLSDLYCPYVVPRPPLRFLQPSTSAITVSIILLNIII